MSRDNTIRGMLLEEAVLYLLQDSGFDIVENDGNDPTLVEMAAGLGVRGRGADHQIDALADFCVQMPFAYPTRLIAEAKCLKNSVGLSVIRNAYGVWQDVQQFWVPPSGNVTTHKRFQYLSAVFSATKFSLDAQKYAFAHGIDLIPLRESVFFRPVIDRLTAVRASDLPNEDTPSKIPMKLLRSLFRSALRDGSHSASDLPESVRNLITKIRDIGNAYVAVMGRHFPVFLTPAEGVRIPEDIQNLSLIRIRRGDGRALLIADQSGRTLFSFDVADMLFNQYAEAGAIDLSRLANVKEQHMGEFQIIVRRNGHIAVYKLGLDREWLDSIRRRTSGQ